MQNQISPLILSFGVSDPLASMGVQADLATFAAIGCHGLPIITGFLVADTSQVDDVYPIEADLVVDQARTVLEDMPVAALKLGQIASVENAAVIAEIISDYPDLPFILDPFSSSIPEPAADAEDLLLAICELLIPQASLLIISETELARIAETWKDSEIDEATDDMATDAMTLIESGCAFVLVTGSDSHSNQIVNRLYDQSGLLRADQWPRIPGSFIGAGSSLAAAVTALLANGLAMPEATLEAQEFTNASIQHAQRLGMGKLIPDRYFWSKEDE
ncbi:MAG: hydroxymethylpyrimidine/phosphomethylpyrimidine kinase [Burkholderiaceae bacterium]|nr:hydroxymethylpyrimidine/phosphomethylpyrimidine kinase [Burkholderiaceae bacterium]